MVYTTRHNVDGVRYHQLLRLFPKHNGAPREMPPSFDDFDFTVQDVNLRTAPDNLTSTSMLDRLLSRSETLDGGRGAGDPVLVFRRVVHRTDECLGPLDGSRVVVRMRNGNRLDPTKLVDVVNRLVVNIRDAVPEYVSFSGTTENRALPKPYLWNGDYTNQSRMVFRHVEFIVILS